MLEEANAGGHVLGYGDDSWTARACDAIRDWFGTACEVFFVFNGTAANAIALAGLCRSYHAVICHAEAHVRQDECGAPGFFGGGTQLLALEGAHGRLTPEAVGEAIRSHFPLHAAKPGALSLTQATERGTVYGVEAVAALSEVAHRHGLKVHMDGARFANALVTLGCGPGEVTWRAGVDVLSLGMTKNGGVGSEALVVFNPEVAGEMEYRVKQGGQLASKMRYLAAPWIGLLEGDVWRRHASRANAMAERLEAALGRLPGIRLLHPREANAVFVELPEPVIRTLRAEGWTFYVFEGRTGCRLMCAWDTREEDVDALAAAVRGAWPAGSGGTGGGDSG